MKDAVLDLGLREDGVDGRVKSSEIIRKGDENILYVPVSQAIEHGRPELGVLIFAYPHAQHIFLAIQIDTYGI